MKRLALSIVFAIISVLAGNVFAAVAAEGFESADVNGGGVLCLKATKAYLKWDEDARKAAVETEARSNPGVLMVAVEYDKSGELWAIEDGHAKSVDSWSGREMRFGTHVRTAGRWFGYVGGQLVRGGDSPSNSWTGRIGTTLFENRYDTALSVSRSNFTGGAGSAVTSVGLNMRALYPYTQHTGVNIGVELDRISYTGYSHISPSAIGGINIYLPGGSFDVTLLFGESGQKSLLVGYTVYISK